MEKMNNKTNITQTISLLKRRGIETSIAGEFFVFNIPCYSKIEMTQRIEHILELIDTFGPPCTSSMIEEQLKFLLDK